MKIRSDVVGMYRDIHSWVGIVAGLALFIAFYAGAITMFEAPLQRWASVPPELAPPPALERTPELVEKVLAEHPDAARGHEIVLETGPEQPARLFWLRRPQGADEHDPAVAHYASLDAEGNLQVTTAGPSPVSQLVDDLHRQIGLPFSHAIAMPIMGAIALLYCIAIVSGVIVLLPTLVRDLFALRIGRNLKRMWLDLHNALGVFSLPFHLIMALTSVVFAFHDQFYDAQEALLYHGNAPMTVAREEHPPNTGAMKEPLLPDEIVSSLAGQAPGFTPVSLQYHADPSHGLELRVTGRDPRYGMRGGTFGIAGVDPYTGHLESTDYMPGLQGAWFATITSFFALHFGNFGGYPVKWMYFVLGMAGAFLFYSGNLLWVETHRKRRRRRAPDADIAQTRGSHFLGSLTVGVCLGCVAGISATIAAAKLIPLWADPTSLWHSVVFYAFLLASVAWAFKRGAARAAVELLYASAVATLCIVLSSLASALIPGFGWNHAGSYLIDLVALAGTTAMYAMARRTAQRVHAAPTDSIWYAGGAPNKAATGRTGTLTST